MMRMLLLASTAVPVSLASSQAVPPAPPPVVSESPSWQSVAWIPGEVRCGGEAVAGEAVRRPLTAIRRGAGPHVAMAVLAYRFRIDATGRPLSIRPDKPGYAFGAGDVAPSLAASRFAAGAPHADCTIRYTLRETPLNAAPVADLISYSLTPTTGKLPPEGWARIRSPESSCLQEPRPRPLLSAFPDFDKLPVSPGMKHWTMVEYDQDSRGRPTRARVAYGTGDAALDRAAVKAMRKSRFTEGARSGCLYPFWRGPTKLAAPEAPDTATLRPAASNCPQEDGWATPPRLRYPAAFQRRSVEGWAIVGYDVAPWGELGNLRVLASEPAAEFGEQALQLLRTARKPQSSTGGVGCVERIVFHIAPGGLPPADDLS